MAGRDLWRSLIKQRHPEQVVQAHVQTAFEAGRLHNILDNLFQHSITHTVKKCFLMLCRTSCVAVCAHYLILALGTTDNSLALPSVHLPYRYLWTLTRPTIFPPVPSLLSSQLNSTSFLSLSSQQRCSAPFIILAALCWTLSSVSMSLSMDTASQQDCSDHS